MQGLWWLLGLAGPATSEILELQIVRLMVFAPATDEILRFHFVRLMVFAGLASDRIFALQIARFVVLTGLAADEILELYFVRLMVFAGPASDRISYSRLPGLWS